MKYKIIIAAVINLLLTQVQLTFALTPTPTATPVSSPFKKLVFTCSLEVGTSREGVIQYGPDPKQRNCSAVLKFRSFITSGEENSVESCVLGRGKTSCTSTFLVSPERVLVDVQKPSPLIFKTEEFAGCNSFSDYPKASTVRSDTQEIIGVLVEHKHVCKVPPTGLLRGEGL